MDINPVMLKMAHHCSAGKNIEWKEGYATSLSFINKPFDLAMCHKCPSNNQPLC
jgi:ubiquinone/menaquinone biosynthesis C-methylase UbiE